MRRYKRFPRAESWQQIRRSTKPQKHSRDPKSRRKALGPVPHSAHPVRKIRKSPRQSRRQPPTPSIGTGPGFSSGYVRRTLLLLPSNGPATSWQTRGCPCNSSFILSFQKHLVIRTVLRHHVSSLPQPMNSLPQNSYATTTNIPERPTARSPCRRPRLKSYIAKSRP